MPKETIQFDMVTVEKGLIVLHSPQGIKLWLKVIDADDLQAQIRVCLEETP